MPMMDAELLRAAVQELRDMPAPTIDATLQQGKSKEKPKKKKCVKRRTKIGRKPKTNVKRAGASKESTRDKERKGEEEETKDKEQETEQGDGQENSQQTVECKEKKTVHNGPMKQKLVEFKERAMTILKASGEKLTKEAMKQKVHQAWLSSDLRRSIMDAVGPVEMKKRRYTYYTGEKVVIPGLE